ncbi:CPSF6 factor, partial [Rostratula benghalensis]|nr:CPSF6 factor [Rostratula benghalensis]
YGGHDQIDLYDDGGGPSANNGDAPEDREGGDSLPPSVGDDVGKGGGPNVVYTYTGKRIGGGIGNLTWWTTDEDLTEAVHSLGVGGGLEIKFFENRANGRGGGGGNCGVTSGCFFSLPGGVALVGVGSEASSKGGGDLLPKRELHGQNRGGTPCNKQFLSQFEMGGGKTTQSGQMSGEGGAGPPGGSSRAAFPGGGRGRGRFPGAIPGGGGFPGPAGPGGPPPPGGGPPGRGGPPGPPPPGQVLPPGGAGPPNRGDRPPPPGGGPGQPFGQPPLGPRGGGPPPPVPGYGPPPGGAPPQQGPPPPPGPGGGRPPGPLGPPLTLGGGPHLPGPPPGAPPPGGDVNPAFFPPPANSGGGTSDSRGPPPTDPWGGPPPYDRGDYGPPGGGVLLVQTPLSEAEFEEGGDRNRAISSSAISRGGGDASAGDYGRGGETLVTAISLIKQSGGGADDRCKVLISSLRGGLHGIESKSYVISFRGGERSRERDHSRSREGGGRHKSRSRDRHDDWGGERSRERERHRDREGGGDRERDREREYRHG